MSGAWLRYVFVGGLVLASGANLMRVSHGVQHAKKEIIKLDRSISQEEEAIRLLEAEWAYLNDPERLEKLAAGYLGLQPAAPEQLVSNVNVLDEKLLTEDVTQASQESAIHVQQVSYQAGGHGQ